MAKILLVEDHPIFRRGLRDILDGKPPFTYIGEAEDAAKALQLLRKESWDALVMDVNLPGKSGLELLKELKLSHPKLPVLVLSVYPEDQYALRMLKAGASGYLTKNRTPEELVAALTKLLQGRKYVSESLVEKVISEFEAGEPAYRALSDREFEVLRLIAAGKPPKDIAAQLHISTRTVNTYRARLLQKLNLKNNAELVRYVIDNQLFSE
ncbi:MAG TPA: response regulator transcription factor [Candidatus Eisenbacteria bacterium]|nr:response regulator transcription factor [Candidatus Eisenbacteria bacterium]